MKDFEMVSPESLGISRAGINAFLEDTRKNGLELHRFALLRFGKCCAEVCWKPYTAQQLHPVYSFSKSLTATAIGFARQEGLLRLDERIADIFPEDLPETVHENLKNCTIHHLLSMSCGQQHEIRDQSANWRRAFFAHEFPSVPGTFYRYNTTGTNLLASIIKKKTGLQVTEYLRPRLFEPLGMGDVYCFRLPDNLGTEAGGGGMKLRLSDMAKFTQFMLQDGCWDGKQFLSDWYFARAGKKQMETAGDSENHVFEWANGYGYQCWMGSLPGSFRADGAFGQFGLVYPTLHLCVITNAATEQTQTLIDAVNAHLLPAVDASVTAPKMDENAAFTEIRSLPVLQSCKNPTLEARLNGASYHAEGESSGLCGLTGGAGLYVVEDDENLTDIRFRFAADRVTLYLTEDGTEKMLTAGTQGEFLDSEVDGRTYAACARWRSLRKLELEIRRMDAMSGVRLILEFAGEKLLFTADETMMTDGGLGMYDRRLCTFRLAAQTEGAALPVTGHNPAVKG